MKIVHVSSSDNGGAAISCLRLHAALLEQGVDSSLITISKKKNIPKHFTYSNKRKASLLERIMFRLGIDVPLYKKQEAALKNKVTGYEYFSFVRTEFDLHNSSIIKDADIINLHWVTGFVDIPTFFKNVKKPIVWTLHDMNSFSGGCHYSCGCMKFKDDCDICPQLLGTIDPALSNKQLILKRQSYKRADITVVAPSNWLAACARSSILFGKRETYVIPYSLNLNIFKPADPLSIRKELNLPLDKKIILFVSSSIENKRKGLDILLKAMPMVQNSNEYIICSVGMNPVGITYENHISLGEITQEQDMMNVYNAADVFVLPATEDNLPNVALEAVACGIPVIGFSIGGMVDIVKPGFNGLLCDKIDAESLARTITIFFNGIYKFDRTAIRKDAEERYNNKLQAETYLSLYKSLLKK
jgi:glycosyltransferase involved in cell wall biosynthesis